MCGIAGSVSQKKTNSQKKQIMKMLLKMKHRGPDHLKISSSSNFCGGYVRLAINDLMSGNQPFYSNDKDIIVYYNGEIYNYKTIKEFLKSKGYKFDTHCDGEILPSLYQEVGDDFFKYIDGMFSISLWDKKKNKLILARDYTGEKPLYYSYNKDFGLIYASEVKSVAANLKTNLKLNKQSLWDMPTFLWIPEPDTIYKSVKSLLPGQYLIFKKNNVIKRKYVFDEKFIQKKFLFSKKNIKNFLDNIILSRSLADAKIGTFLSSGIDSSIVTKILSKKKNFKTYTVSFPKIDDIYDKNANVDEYIGAKKFAQKIGLKNTKIKLREKEILKEFIAIAKKSDQPHAISSAIGISIVSKRAKKDGVKVLISGDGADEIFGGYKWYSHLDNIIKKKNKKNKNSKIDVTLQSKNIDDKKIIESLSNYNSQNLMQSLHYYGTETEKKSIFNKKFKKKKKSSLRFFYKKKINPMDIINHDRKFYLTNEMMNKLDRHTMQNSIEGRSPFTSPYIKKIITKYSFKELIKKGDLKQILKKNYKREIGSEIINRKKHGFNFPIDYCLKNSWKKTVEETFDRNSCLIKKKIIDTSSITKINKMLNDDNKNHGHTILSFIAMKFWLDNNPWKL